MMQSGPNNFQTAGVQPMPYAAMRAAAAFLLFVVSPIAFAAEPWDAAPLTADPKEMLAAAERVSAGESDAVILLEETHHLFDEHGRGLTTERFIYRIAADSAIDAFGSVNAPWAPWYQERPVIRARVITKDGTVHELDPGAIVEAPAAEQSLDIFSDNRIIRAPLPAVAVGSVVEQVITYKSKESLYDAASSDVFFFGSFKPVHKSRFVVDAPASLHLTFVNRSDVQPVRTEQDGRVRVVYEGGAFAARTDLEWDLPFDVSPMPWVGVSTAKSWQDLARRYDEIVNRQIGTASLAAITREAIGNAKDKREIVAKALAWIQKRVRYAGVEVGESSVVPRPPTTVLSNRYGDCKDKATLLVAMLRQAGLKAHVALLRAGADFDVPSDLPGLGMFNHAIVVVDDAAPIWVDPTDEFARAGELPIMDQGRLALVASAETSSLVQTPESSSNANRTLEVRTFTLPEEGKAKVTEVTEAWGADESQMRRVYVDADRKRYREQMEEYVKSYYGAKALTAVDAGDPHDLSKPFRLLLAIDESQRGVAIDGEAAVAIFPQGLLDSLPWSLRNFEFDQETKRAKKPRRNDFLFARPFVKEWRYRIVPPQGFVARTLPEGETRKLGTATLTREFTTESNGVVVASFKFDSGKRRLSGQELETMARAIEELSDSGPVMIGFEQLGQLELNNGNIAAALREFRHSAKLHPAEGRHQVEIAKALLAGGMGEAAREQIRKAIALEPSYARAHRMQGVILQHDLFARPFRRGFDLAGAIAAYRKAKELDPKDTGIRAELARLLEHGENGVPFGRGAKLDEAIAEYRALIKDYSQERFRPDLYRALAYAGRFDELQDELRDAPNAALRTMWTVVIAATKEGSPAAIRAARAEEANDRKEILSNAGAILLALRRYDVAADLMEEAQKGAPSGETRQQIESIRKAKRIEELTFPADDPKSVVRRFTIANTLGELDADKAHEFFASDEKDLFTDRNEFRMARVAVQQIARQQGLPLEFYADVALGVSQFTQDGDEETGYRIRMRTPGGSGVENDTMFVIRDGKEYRISASRRVPALIGFSVKRLLDAGKTDAARQWLNWAREEMQAGSGDDPLSGHPFARVWTRGKAQATVDEMRLASALLMPSKELADLAAPMLIAAREKASDDEKLRIDQSLAAIYASKEDWAAMLPVAQRLYAAAPDSANAFNTLTAALTNLDRNDEAVKLANERLTRIEKDEDAMRALAQAAMQKGNYAESDKLFRQILDQLRPNAGDYNNVAWNALLYGKDLDRALEDARQAMKMPGSGSALLHTVASLYAETGKSLEAREALLQSMDTAGREEPAPHDWYVLGRIAENYGARDAALAAYKRVDKPKTTLASSTWVLAERRLREMK